MSKFTKSGLTLLLVLVLLVSFLPSVSIEVGAADFSYKYDGKYIYNWGERGTTATFLSPNAIAFYETWGSYSELSSLSGSTERNSVPSSALYKELKSIMTSAHKYINSYADNKDAIDNIIGGGGSIEDLIPDGGNIEDLIPDGGNIEDLIPDGGEGEPETEPELEPAA